MFDRKNFLTYSMVCLVLFGLGLLSVFGKGNIDPHSGTAWMIILIPLAIAILLMIGHIRDRRRAKNSKRKK